MPLQAIPAKRAPYAKLAEALSSKAFRQIVDLASGDVVQLVRTLPCHYISNISLAFSITCVIGAKIAF